ncbi:MAG: hypothetical protein ACJA1L_003423 [Paracoccaceae bacterium]|jgi:hypothetical protein
MAAHLRVTKDMNAPGVLVRPISARWADSLIPTDRRARSGPWTATGHDTPVGDAAPSGIASAAARGHSCAADRTPVLTPHVIGAGAA